MKLVVIMVALLGCSSKDYEREDLELFCSPEAAAKAPRLTELGPFLEAKLHDTEFKRLWLGIKTNSVSLHELEVKVTTALAERQITPCPTLAKLFEPAPAAHP